MSSGAKRSRDISYKKTKKQEKITKKGKKPLIKLKKLNFTKKKVKKTNKFSTNLL